MGASRTLGIFTQPNADFRVGMSEEETIILKSWDRNDKRVMLDPPSLGPQPERQVVNTREAFHRHKIILRYEEGAELKDAGEVISAVDAGRPLVGQTDFLASGYRVELEYPVFTINVSERYDFYQTDTGPVIYPDLTAPFERMAETLWLAFSAFSSPDWTEFIVQRPTSIGEGVSVNHYSESVWVDSTNRLIATD